MLNIQHIRELSSIELRVLSFIFLHDDSLEITQQELAQEINCSDKSVGNALRLLESRGIISYERGTLETKYSKGEKGKITLH